MSESQADQIEKLLAEGLEFYGLGDTSDAFVAWKKVLALDPENAQALDFISSADRRRFPREEEAAPAALASPLEEARQMMAEHQYDEALEFLQNPASTAPQGVELHALVELLRGLLHREHRARIGDLSRVPVRQADDAALTQYNLPTNAGFLLSMLDGATSLEDVISVSGMDAFDALKTVTGLLDAGLVELRA
jgi:tetratricopeptide (TPR) repeat protein